MTYFKKISILFFILLFTADSISAIEIKKLSVAVDIAGKQRMFTQRLLKDYAMVGMKNKFGKPNKNLEKIIASFEDHMNSLYVFTKDMAIKESIEKGKEFWKPIKKSLTIEAKKEKVVKLQKDLEVLLKNADDTTKLFAKQMGKKSAEIINISGRQRMLSQRMASLYMIKVWGIEDPEFKMKMKDAMSLFKISLEKLMKYEKNTPEILVLLKNAKRSFMFFEFMNRSKKRFVPTLIYKKSNEILENMNTATKLYVKIEKS